VSGAFGLVGVLGQGDPIVMRCISITLGVLSVERGTATQRQLLARCRSGGQEVRPIEMLLAGITANVSRIRNRITHVSGGQDLVRCLHTLGQCCLSRRKSRLALLQCVRTYGEDFHTFS
jgi:hypothetical protein